MTARTAVDADDADGASLADLRSAVTGDVVGPDPGAVAAALADVYNPAVAHAPLAVVLAHDAEDVAAVMRWAAPRRVPVGVVATGHGGWPQRGVVVSTRHLDRVGVDPATRRGVVGAGVRWRGLLEAAAPYGLTGLAGSTSQVSVVGHVVGGGISPLARTYGYTTDWVRRLTVVTGDGRIHREVTADHEPDLFHAVLGGKDTVGIVTELEIELIALERLVGGAIFYDGADAAAVLHAFPDWARALPTETTASVALLRLPDQPDVPPPLRGRCCVHLRVVHVGDAAEADALLAPVRAVATPLIDTVAETPATAFDGVHLDPPGPLPGWDTGAYLASVDDAAVDRLLELAGPDRDVPLIMAELRPVDGAAARTAQGCVGRRDAAWLLGVITAMAPELATVAPSAGRALVDGLAPWATGLRPANWGGADAMNAAPASYWDEDDAARLTTASWRHDPAGILGGPRFGLRG